jgi:hypothetical protein
MLLARGKTQIGVQAKLQANIKVLLQALPGLPKSVDRKQTGRGPTYRVVLCGGFTGRTADAQNTHQNEFTALAKQLRLLVAVPPVHHLDTWMKRLSGEPLNLMTRYAPIWQEWNSDGTGARPDWRIAWRWYRWSPMRAEKTPAVVPDVPAGVPSPEQVTPWSIAAVLLERRCESRRIITTEDARVVQGIVGGSWSPSTMLSRYFKYSPARGGWALHPDWPRPSERHRGTARSLEGKSEESLLESAGQQRLVGVDGGDDGTL